ncbi:MAG: GxxExxY protein [Anaerolineae bacterium]|nr:GxxExxY protein [Anaerolineae bacterium]
MIKEEDRLSKIIIGAAIEVHRTLGGCGLLESVYEEALVWELEQQKLNVERQKVVPIQYKAVKLAAPLRLDIRVEKCVIIECKAVADYNALFETQTLTYLRLMKLRLGLVINFGEKYVKNGVKRVVNKL